MPSFTNMRLMTKKPMINPVMKSKPYKFGVLYPSNSVELTFQLIAAIKIVYFLSIKDTGFSGLC